MKEGLAELTEEQLVANFGVDGVAGVDGMSGTSTSTTATTGKLDPAKDFGLVEALSPMMVPISL